MESLIEYPDYEGIPPDILPSLEEIKNKLPSNSPLSISQRVKLDNVDNYPVVKTINPELQEFLSKIFDVRFKAVFVITKITLDIHVDLSSYLLMWLIDPGGEDIKTAFYKKDIFPSDLPYYECSILPSAKHEHMKIHEEVIPVNTWVKLSSHVPHAVLGTINRPRVYLTVSLESSILPDLPKKRRPDFY